MPTSGGRGFRPRGKLVAAACGGFALVCFGVWIYLGDTKVEVPDGSAEQDGPQEPSPADLVEQPAKVMRIGSMIKQLLEEVRTAPLDEASRVRLRDIHRRSIAELESGLAPELVEELEEELGERSVGFRIEDEDLEDLKTVRDAVDYVYDRVKEA